jgi:alanine racemase
MAVVKADAYGHGALAVSRLALQQGAEYLAVAVPDEAVQLRQNGIEAPILVLGGMHPDDAHLFPQYDLEATVYEASALSALKRAARKYNQPVKAHVKVDTGMGRVGVDWRQAFDYVTNLVQDDAIDLRGVYMHFATSDHMDKSYAQLQLARFNEAISTIKARHVKIPLVHAANSAAIIDLADSYFDMVRPGIMMYGHYPSRETTESIPLQSAMTFKTKVLYAKTVERGQSVSYSRQFIASQPTQVLTLPVGYADGYNRQLSNRGQVLIKGKRYPVVGRVCMDMIMVDAGPDGSAAVGDEVVLFGRQGAEEVPVQSICDLLGTIPYEVTCWVSKRVPRVYKNENR